MMTARQQVEIDRLQIKPLNDGNELTDFNSGEQEVDRGAGKCLEWHRQYRNRTFCAFVPNFDKAVGFYCLGINGAEKRHLTGKIFKTERTDYIPFIYLHYVGVRSEFQSQGIGTILLLNALEKSAHTIQNIGIFGVALNAVNEKVAMLYERYGFRPYDEKHRFPFMVLPAMALLELFEPI